MRKKISIILIGTFMLGLMLPSTGLAVSGNEPSYTYWMESSHDYTHTTYGDWVSKKNAFTGPGTMSKGYESSAGVTVGGNIPRSGLSVGLTKGVALSTEASREIPEGKKGRLQIRNVYKHYKVHMEEWQSIDGRKSKTGKTKTGTAKRKDEIESRIILE